MRALLTDINARNEIRWETKNDHEDVSHCQIHDKIVCNGSHSWGSEKNKGIFIRTSCFLYERKFI